MIGYVGWGHVAVAFIVVYVVFSMVLHHLWRKHGGGR